MFFFMIRIQKGAKPIGQHGYMHFRKRGTWWMIKSLFLVGGMYGAESWRKFEVGGTGMEDNLIEKLMIVLIKWKHY